MLLLILIILLFGFDRPEQVRILRGRDSALYLLDPISSLPARSSLNPGSLRIGSAGTAEKLGSADHSLRRRNHTTVRARHRVGKITPSSTKASALPILWIIQLKFIPKKPVMNVRGRKMIDTSVNRLI